MGSYITCKTIFDKDKSNEKEVFSSKEEDDHLSSFPEREKRYVLEIIIGQITILGGNTPPIKELEQKLARGSVQAPYHQIWRNGDITISFSADKVINIGGGVWSFSGCWYCSSKLFGTVPDIIRRQIGDRVQLEIGSGGSKRYRLAKADFDQCLMVELEADDIIDAQTTPEN